MSSDLLEAEADIPERCSLDRHPGVILGVSESYGSREANLRWLLLEISEAESREQNRIAQDLHDGLGQTLAIALMKIGELAREPLSQTQAILLDELKCLLHHGVRVTRSVTYELGSPVLRNHGLVPAIQDLANRFSGFQQPRMEIVVDSRLPEIPNLVSETLFRAVRELTLNAHKHARACVIQVRLLGISSGIELQVVDDGIGFQPRFAEACFGPHGGFGLMSLRAQITALGGRLMFCASPGHGTHVRIQCPLIAEDILL